VHILFHVVATAGLAAALLLVHTRRTVPVALGAALAYATLGALAGIRLSPTSFEAMALGAWGIFFYGILYLVGAAALHIRRPAARPAVLFAAALATMLFAIGVDAFMIEPRALETNRVTLEGAGLRRPLRIALIADFQTERIGEHERAAIRGTLAERPDLIVLTGDYLQIRGLDRYEKLRREFRALLAAERWSAPLGVYAVPGHCEGGGWEALFAGQPVTTLSTTTTMLVRDDVVLTGLTLDDSFRTDLVIASDQRFQVVFGHGPDFALGSGVGAELLLAGHTHGGQVRLPWIGPLIKASAVPRAWAAGRTDLPAGRTLFVSRGIGMERHDAPRLRFLCRPEIVILDVVPAGGAS
jgi:predicted MPP superfamily phosphohydrolase